MADRAKINKQKKVNGKTQFFDGIGESPFVEDGQLGVIPVITENDSDEMKQLKNSYIRMRLKSIRSIMDFN